jgi:hypothetical protein
MKNIIILLASAFFTYIVAWTITYIVLMGFNFKYYMEYFCLSWGNPGEIPALIRIISLLVTIVFVICLLLWMKRTNRV